MRDVRRIGRARRPLVALLALVIALAVGYLVKAASGDGGGDGGGAGSGAGSGARASTVALSSLPPQAATTITLIEAGGPFPYPRNDGVVFHNYEHRLPGEPDGYYHEYTVPTPGSQDRGARRIIAGRGATFWWTGDHYETFQRIEVGR